MIFGQPGHAQEQAEAADTTTDTVTTEKVPFEGMDMTWQNGADRREKPLLQTPYFTGIVMLDANYTHSFNNPNDNTVVGSTALARNNEIQLSGIYLGGEFNYKNAHARIITQFGTRSIVVPRNDYSVFRGQYDLANAYRYLSEAYA
ncbi:MAG: porin, partial [Sphingobacteriales bacterium]